MTDRQSLTLLMENGHWDLKVQTLAQQTRTIRKKKLLELAPQCLY